MEIREFIEARLAEDEREHSPVVDGTQSTWAWFGGSESRSERALREVAAKRAILKAAADYSPELEHGDNGEWALDLVLRLLASVWVDHPDFDPAWRING